MPSPEEGGRAIPKYSPPTAYRPRDCALRCPCRKHRGVGGRPRAERQIHATLVARWGAGFRLRAPWNEDGQPDTEGRGQDREAPRAPGSSPVAQESRSAEQGERSRDRSDGNVQTAPHAEPKGERPISAPTVFVGLIELRQRIEGGEQRTEGEQYHHLRARHRKAGGRPPCVRCYRAKTPHVDEPVGA